MPTLDNKIITKHSNPKKDLKKFELVVANPFYVANIQLHFNVD